MKTINMDGQFIAFQFQTLYKSKYTNLTQVNVHVTDISFLQKKNLFYNVAAKRASSLSQLEAHKSSVELATFRKYVSFY